MPRHAATTWNDDAWDQAWAAADAGRGVTLQRSAAPARPRGRLGRGLGLVALLLALPIAWFAGPALLAGEVLRGLENRDAAALSARVDWALATPNLATALRDAGGQDHGPGARRFLDGVAGGMAAAWSQPEAREAVLAGRALQPAALQSARVEGLDRVVLNLGAGPGLTLTLSMTEPTRLGWAITGLGFVEAAAPAGTLAPAPLRPAMVDF